MLNSSFIMMTSPLRSLPYASVLLLSILCSGCEVDTTHVGTWWVSEAQTPSDESYTDSGFGIRMRGFATRSLAGTNNDHDLLSLVLLDAPEGGSCSAYARYLTQLRDLQLWYDEITQLPMDDPARPTNAVIIGHVCQEINGAARAAFGDDGRFRALHFLMDMKDGAPVSSGEFRAASLGDEAGGLQGAELLADTDGTKFVARYYERMPHGDGILPDNDLAQTATALDPVAACPLFFSNLVESGGDLPDGAVPVLQGASHRYYHGFRGQESWPIGDEDVPNALVAPTFSQLGTLGGEVQSTAIVRTAGTVDAFPYDVVMLSSRNDFVPVEACSDLEDVLPFMWPEYGPLGWSPGSELGDEY